MNAKSSVRLRLECLETRSLLSAIGLPFVLPAAPPSVSAAAAGFYRIGGQQVAHAVMADAVQNLTATPLANPPFTPDRLPLYAQPVTDSRISDPMLGHDFHPVSDPVGEISLLSGSTLDVATGFADSGSVAPLQNLSESSPVVTFDSTKWQGGGAASIDRINAGSVAPSLETSNSSLLSPDGMADGQNVFTTLANHDPMPPRFASDVAAYAMPAFGTVMLSHGTNEVQPDSDALPPSRAPADFHGALVRGADPAATPTDAAGDNNGLLGMESLTPLVTFAPPVAFAPPVTLVASPVTLASPTTLTSPVKGRVSDALPASDTNSLGVQEFPTAQTSLPAPNGVANPLATNLAVSDTGTSVSMEDGFITLGDAAAVTPQLGTAPSYDVGFQGVGIAELKQGTWLSNLLPNTSKPADSAGGTDKATRSGEKFTAEISSRPGTVILQPAVESEEGGSVELVICAPSTATAGDNSLPAGASTAGAAEQLSEIRPESGVGLFCDIDVAMAPTLPMGDAVSTATTYQNAGSLAAGTGSHGWNANAVTEFVPPRTKSWQPALAGLADSLPLLLGATILVSRGGIRLEEEVSERERRLFCIENLRRSPT